MKHKGLLVNSKPALNECSCGMGRYLAVGGASLSPQGSRACCYHLVDRTETENLTGQVTSRVLPASSGVSQHAYPSVGCGFFVDFSVHPQTGQMGEPQKDSSLTSFHLAKFANIPQCWIYTENSHVANPGSLPEWDAAQEALSALHSWIVGMCLPAPVCPALVELLSAFFLTATFYRWPA